MAFRDPVDMDPNGYGLATGASDKATQAIELMNKNTSELLHILGNEFSKHSGEYPFCHSGVMTDQDVLPVCKIGDYRIYPIPEGGSAHIILTDQFDSSKHLFEITSPLGSAVS